MKDLYGQQTPPPHPGEVLREDILPHYALSRRDFARHLKISTRVLGELLRERRPVSLELAIKLGAAFGQGAHFWLGLQAQHDLWHARDRETDIRPIARRHRRVGRICGAEQGLAAPAARANGLSAQSW